MSYLSILAQRRVAIVFGILLLLLLATLGGTYYAFNYPRFVIDQHQTFVYGATRYSPETPSSLRVLVREPSLARPIENANVTVRLEPKGSFAGLGSQTLFAGKTDARGTVPVVFTIPANTAREQTLIVETSSSAGHDRIEKPVTVLRDYRVLVTTDKPLYQPSQTIHLRALALGVMDRTPAKGQGIEFLIEDPKGNKLFRKTMPASDYGIASSDFVLADTVTAGAYKITASVGGTKSEKTVTVKPYVLPKFKVSIETERTYYMPGDRVTGRVRADYFFGKPAGRSDVTLRGFVFDIASAQAINLTGKTDADGVYVFAFTLPNYFAGTGLNRSRADFGLDVSVTDQANHTEQASLALPIASEAIIIDAVPESGKLVMNVENIVYVMTSLPDGTPLETDLTVAVVGGTPMTQTRTGKYGLAEYRFTPRGSTSLSITARNVQGRSANRTITLSPETTSNQILLRPDRAVYRVGESMHLDAFSSGSIGTVYLDLIKENQTVSTRAIDIVNGKASIDLDVTPDLIGTLQLHAYHVEKDGTIVRDARVVVVEQPGELNIAIKPDRDVYRPGDNSRVSFAVTNARGKGVPSALGITAVDESVFALAEQDPGFAKLYFLLQKELLEPRYELHGFSLPEVVAPSRQSADVAIAQDQSARAAWASAPVSDFSLRVNSQPEKRDLASKGQLTAYNTLGFWIATLLFVIPFAVGALVISGLRAKGILQRSFDLWIGGIFGYCIGAPIFVAIIIATGWFLAQSRLTTFAILTIALAWLAGFAVLVAHAVMKRDARLQVILMLLVAYLMLMGLGFYLQGKMTPLDSRGMFAIVVTYLATLALLVLLGIGLLVQKETNAGIAAIFIAILFIPATILLAMMPYAGPFLSALGNPAVYVPEAYLTACAPVPTPAAPGILGVSAPAPTAAPAATQAPQAAQQKDSTRSAETSVEPPRLRQYFPETLYVNPEAITDENGRVTLDIPLADSITTWRLAATASSQRGGLGSASAGIRVFQDFFVDLDLPVALTQNDEISVPVAVYNYLPQSQKVRLQLDSQPSFTLQGDAEKTLTIASNDIEVVYFRIKATSFGMQKLLVNAIGEKMSDAIQREIHVYPDGKSFETTQSNWLKGAAEQVIDIPGSAIPGASRVQVKIYPGIMSQVVEGLDAIFQMPNGCFEQTSSTTYPNVLALNYLKQTKQGAPEVQLKAENYIGLGYQRLLTFESPTGGFSLFPGQQTSVMLSSKGALEFNDMSKVYPIDAAVIERTRKWILTQQRPDGTWSGSAGWDHPPAGPGDPLPLTAIVTWSLLESGTSTGSNMQDPVITRAIGYLRENSSKLTDAYTLALVTNAMVAYNANDSFTQNLLARLNEMKTTQGEAAYWGSKGSTMTGAYGKNGNLETTALAAYAFLRSHAYTDSANRALTYLIQNKDPRGTWGTTQATILALKALVQSISVSGDPAVDATVRITFNHGQEKTITLNRQNADVLQLISFGDVAPGANSVSFKVEGKGSLAYQVSTQYYLPWSVAPATPELDRLVNIQVAYDRTNIAVNDLVGVTSRISLTKPGSVRMALIDLGVPPGFQVMSEDLDALVKAKTISRYDITGRQIIVYLDDLNFQKPVAFTYHLKAKFPLRAQTPSSSMYDYYNPTTGAVEPPFQVVVK